MSNNELKLLRRENKPDLAYIHYEGGDENIPTLMFLGGFRSDMLGSKASFLQAQCESRGQNYIRFDYSGHGQSGGEFVDGCISDWRDDAADILKHCTENEVILVGSSMGGWISLLLACYNSIRIKALIGIAAAPDFTGWMEEGMNDKQRQALDDEGFFELPSDYGTPYIITKKLIEDGRNNFLLNGPININIPVRLLQGKKDKDVPWQTAEKIKKALSSSDVEVFYRENGNHSLSSPQDLEVLNQVIEKIL
jgi:pimeloyl-ACP methyl ester carboxylesterase